MAEIEIFDLTPEGARKFLKKEAKRKKKAEKAEKVKSADKKAEKKAKKQDDPKIAELKKLADAKKASMKAEKEKRRREEEAAAERHQAEVDMIQLLTRKKMLQGKLSSLNPNKKKDAIKIASINVELMDVDEAIDSIRKDYGIQMDDVNCGSKVKRFFNRIGNALRGFGRKVKKFVHNNAEVISAVITCVIPLIGSYAGAKMNAKA